MRFLSRLRSRSLGSELSMHWLNNFMKKLSEYWYMGPMSARSATTK